MLESKARSRSDELGISINAMVSVAVDAYLKSVPDGNYEAQIKVVPVVFHQPASLVAGEVTSKLTKKQRQEFTAFERRQRKLGL